MSSAKPKNVGEYKTWLKEKHGSDITQREISYYNTVVSTIANDFRTSVFWQQLVKNFPGYHDEYLLSTGYPLLSQRETQLEILTKSFDSFLEKTFRKNILENNNWITEPEGGWLLPSNWHSKINDSVRTLIQVKYLDGVEFVIDKIKSYCKEQSMECSSHLEAREEGYYAAHLYVRRSFEIPRINWDTERVEVSVEIQITTQLQEVIRRLLHKYYEENRKAKNIDSQKWQWNYKSDEFSAAYLGHILHYVEGMIMEIREKQKKKETT